MIAAFIQDAQRGLPSAERFAHMIRSDDPDLSGGLRFVASARHTGYVDSGSFVKYLAKLAAEMGWRTEGAGELGTACGDGGVSRFDFTDKVMLVTGGAGGIGSAMCRHSASGGARCVVVDINEIRAKKVASELSGSGHTGIGCDLTDRAQVEELLDRVAATHGRLDVLVNNVGMTSAERFDVRDVESIEQEIKLNLISPLVTTRIAIPLLRASGDPRVVTTVSSAGSSRWARRRSTRPRSSGCAVRCSRSRWT